MNRKTSRPTIGVPGNTGTQARGGSAEAASLIKEGIRLFQLGDLRGAEKCAVAFMKAAPNHPEGFHLRGLIAFQQGNSTKAVDLIGKAIKAGSRNPAHQVNYALALKTANRLEEAAEAYDLAVTMDPGNGGAWNDRGNVLSSLGRMGDAEASYQRAIECQPQDYKPYMNFGALLLAQGRNDLALEVCRKAVALAPEIATTQNGLGNALKATGDVNGAIAAYESAVALDPDLLDALGNLASLYEETNQLVDARKTAEHVLRVHPKHAHASLVLAKCERRGEFFERAIDRLEFLNRSALPAMLRRDVAFELSRLYDRVEKPEEAFAAMAEGNGQALIAEGVDETLGDQFLETVSRLQDWITPENVTAVKALAHVDDGQVDPIFLVGFPRSGTTLLGQVLDSHSDLIMVEERPMLDRLVAQVRADQAGYPDAITGFDEDVISRMRQSYFDAVDQECQLGKGQRVVDKFPLHLVHVGLIRAVFPAAQFIFALRHPCDVVLSCFMQNFRPNPAMANFFSIERGARAYNHVMSLWRSYKTHFNPPVHVVRYENMVTDFDVEVNELLTFLGLEWEDGVREFAERALTRGKIDTPSYAQVTEDLYTRARYRWLRYKEQMEPVIPILTPWIKDFTYPDVESE